MPGLGAEAMIFLYAGLSGLTVLADHPASRFPGRSGRYSLFCRSQYLPFPSALCDDLWQYPMVFYSRNPAGNVVLEKCENIVEKNVIKSEKKP